MRVSISSIMSSVLTSVASKTLGERLDNLFRVGVAMFCWLALGVRSTMREEAPPTPSGALRMALEWAGASEVAWIDLSRAWVEARQDDILTLSWILVVSALIGMAVVKRYSSRAGTMFLFGVLAVLEASHPGTPAASRWLVAVLLVAVVVAVFMFLLDRGELLEGLGGWLCPALWRSCSQPWPSPSFSPEAAAAAHPGRAGVWIRCTS